MISISTTLMTRRLHINCDQTIKIIASRVRQTETELQRFV